jgi:hypothetical protein
MRMLAIGVAAVLTALLPVGGGHSTERERLHVLSEACRISPTVKNPALRGVKGGQKLDKTTRRKVLAQIKAQQ